VGILDSRRFGRFRESTPNRRDLLRTSERAGEVIWRVKTPIEFGTGTAVLPIILDVSISDGEFERKVSKYLEEDKVALRDKEELFYYEIYRSILGIPGIDESYGRTCPKCRSNIRPEVSYCRTCGAFPI